MHNFFSFLLQSNCVLSVCIISVITVVIAGLFLWLEQKNRNEIIALFHIRARSNILKNYLSRKNKLSEGEITILMNRCVQIKYWLEQLSGEFYLTRAGFLKKTDKTKHRLPQASMVNCSVIVDDLIWEEHQGVFILELNLVNKSKKTDIVVWKKQGKIKLQLKLFYNMKKFPIFADMFFS